jgi:hypothetical protein
MEQNVEAEVNQDLRQALKAAKELIESLREYAKNLATDLDESKGQINILKERLHENTKAPEDERSEKKQKLAQWIKEAADEKANAMSVALRDVENRQMKFELDALKKSASPAKASPAKASRQPGAIENKNGNLVVIACVVGVGFVVGWLVGSRR